MAQAPLSVTIGYATSPQPVGYLVQPQHAPAYMASHPAAGGYGASRREGKMALTSIAITDILLILVTILCMCYGSFHFTTLAFATGANISFDVGLFTVTTSGSSRGLFGIAQLTKALDVLKSGLNGKSLAVMESLICGIEMLALLPSGCDSIIMLRTCSYLLVAAMIVSILFWLIGAATCAVFWARRPQMIIRRILFFTHTVPGILMLIGIILYLTIGGTDIRFGQDIPGLMADVSPVDLAGGFFLACLIGIVACMLPVFMYFMVPETTCTDYYAKHEYGTDREIDELLRQRHEHYGIGG